MGEIWPGIHLCLTCFNLFSDIAFNSGENRWFIMSRITNNILHFCLIFTQFYLGDSIMTLHVCYFDLWLCFTFLLNKLELCSEERKHTSPHIAQRCCGHQKCKCLQRQIYKSSKKSVLRTVMQKMQPQLSPQEIPALQLLWSEGVYQGKHHSIWNLSLSSFVEMAPIKDIILDWRVI